jgi:geranylgeranyl transferase type-2 subunit alpha
MDILDDVNDCKWIYQALIDCKLLMVKLQGSMTEQDRGELRSWLSALKELDTLRTGRWMDLEQKLGTTIAQS